MSTHDPLDIRGQERIQANRAMRDKLERESEESDIRWLMSSKRGRRVVWRLLDQAGVFRSSFNTNAMEMAFAEGNRNYGLRILSMIHSQCPELYPTMMKEQTTDERINDDGSRNSN
jgi:hypothetical protein